MEATAAPLPSPYPANVEFEYRDSLSRLTTFFRPILSIPILIILMVLSPLNVFSTGLMVLFRKKYPRWWFDYNAAYTAFTLRVWAYGFLLDDRYPSTDEPQGVTLTLDPPGELNRWLPLVKWLLLIPHFIVLVFLYLASFFALVGAWFAILFTGRYPRPLFNFVTGVMRWGLRVQAYGFLLTTDQYPPFRLKA